MTNKTITAIQKLTPSSNTGLNGEMPAIAARCHWLQGTFKLHGKQQLMDLFAAIAQTVRDEVVINEGRPAFHGLRYDNCAESGTGVRVAWNQANNVEEGRAWLGIPGSALDRITLLELRTLGIYLLNSTGLKVTRYDAAIDDFTRRIDPLRALTVAMHGGLHGAETYSIVGKGKRGHMAITAYFGAFGSDKMVRCYDKWEETDGEVDAIRWEAQFRDELAHKSFQTLMDSSEGRYAQHMAQCIARQVTGAIDFTDPDSGRRYSEQTRAAWWSSLVEDAGGEIRVTVSHIRTTIAAKLNWLERQVAPALAQLYDLSAIQFGKIVKRLREVGRNRLTPSHYAQMTAFLGLEPARRHAILAVSMGIR